jgi:hypothetical protein
LFVTKTVPHYRDLNLGFLVSYTESQTTRSASRQKFDKYLIISIISAERRSVLDIGLPQSSPQRSVLCCPYPAASRDLHQIVGPPCGGPTNVASLNKQQHSFGQQPYKEFTITLKLQNISHVVDLIQVVFIILFMKIVYAHRYRKSRNARNIP